MIFNMQDSPRIIYACDRCCSKVERAGAECPHCHRGVGVQVDPAPKKEQKESVNLCGGVRRGRKGNRKL